MWVSDWGFHVGLSDWANRDLIPNLHPRQLTIHSTQIRLVSVTKKPWCFCLQPLSDSNEPYGSKYLLRRCLGWVWRVQTPSEDVLGALGEGIWLIPSLLGHLVGH